MDDEQEGITFLSDYLTFLHYKDLRHRKSLLKKPLSFIKEHSLNFLKWSPNFNEISIKSLNLLVWVTLNNIHAELCDLKNFIQIGESLGGVKGFEPQHNASNSVKFLVNLKPNL